MSGFRAGFDECDAVTSDARTKIRNSHHPNLFDKTTEQTQAESNTDTNLAQTNLFMNIRNSVETMTSFMSKGFGERHDHDVDVIIFIDPGNTIAHRNLPPTTTEAT